MIDRDTLMISIKHTAEALTELARAASRPSNQSQGREWDIDAAQTLLRSAINLTSQTGPNKKQTYKCATKLEAINNVGYN